VSRRRWTLNSPFFGFVIAGVVSILIGPSVIRMLINMKARQSIREDAPKSHQHKQGTPTMGGLIIFLGIIAGIGAICGVSREYCAEQSLWAVVSLTLACGLLGFLDDFLSAKRGKNLGLKARHKLVGQFAVAIGFVVWICALRGSDATSIHILGRALDLGYAYYPLAVLLIVGMSNAVNLTDGLDGLAGGLCMMVMLTSGWILKKAGESGLSLIAFSTAGGCVGFLKYNMNPAKVFMGDTGSLALGGLLAGLAIAARQEALFLALGLIFIIEALSVTIQVISFKTTGKRVFRMSPIHHHFELCGWPEQSIVKRFWLVQCIVCVLALLLFR